VKLITLIFAFLILVLSSVPCSDEVGEIAQTENHSDHDHEEDNCPPFCICACCGVNFSLQTDKFEMLTIVEVAASNNFYHNNVYTKGYVNAVWQPPSIS